MTDAIDGPVPGGDRPVGVIWHGIFGIEVGMGVEWGFVMIHPDTHEPVEGAEQNINFDPEIWHSRDIDIMLVGDEEGPLDEMLKTVPQDDFDPDDPDSFDMVILPDAVRQCAAHPAMSPTYPVPSLEDLIKERLFESNPGEEQYWYDSLMETTNEFRRFIADAASHGHALLHWAAV